jgi:Holliday junction resolvase RusA-like endonuclease
MSNKKKLEDMFKANNRQFFKNFTVEIEEEIESLTDKDLAKISKILSADNEENPEQSFTFVYYTEFKPADRPRAVPVLDPNTKQFKGIRFYDPIANKESKIDLRESLLYYIRKNSLLPINSEDRIVPIKGSFQLSVKFFKKIPESFTRTEVILAEAGILTPDSTPDTDNIGKNILDAFLKHIYIDDKLNDSLLVRKFFSVRPRIEITLKYKMKKLKTKKI